MKNFKPKLFVTQVKEELQKVNWPTRQATVTTSLVVLVVVGMITVYLGVADALISRIMRMIIGG